MSYPNFLYFHPHWWGREEGFAECAKKLNLKFRYRNADVERLDHLIFDEDWFAKTYGREMSDEEIQIEFKKFNANNLYQEIKKILKKRYGAYHSWDTISLVKDRKMKTVCEYRGFQSSGFYYFYTVNICKRTRATKETGKFYNVRLYRMDKRFLDLYAKQSEVRVVFWQKSSGISIKTEEIL